ncbi:interleukin-15 receptor subunit alpha isoform X6 [Grammomys surdaster]|uniref:interleukin-15 receptor subunit alpha isoform X6 n=1 Tax=Grammomys surdaster TaxID=491861 RepID=UPI00109FAE46|nr:interleukin-15 receptor subunit alpha isoform X6 [Grammomys surdaster]
MWKPLFSIILTHSTGQTFLHAVAQSSIHKELTGKLQLVWEPEALSPKSDTTVATETAIMPGSRLTPFQPTSAGTTETGSHKSSRAPSLAATMTLEPTASTSLRITEISPHSSKTTKVAISTSVLLVGAGVVVVFLAWYIKSRQTSQSCPVGVETMEMVPMTVRTSTKEDEDTGA